MPVQVRNNQKSALPDAGFSLAESVVAAALIAVVIVAFTSFMTSMSAAQTRLRNDQIASRVLSEQSEMLSAVKWDDLLLATPGGTCPVNGAEKPTAIVKPGPETKTVDGLTLSISRDIVWTGTSTKVTCAKTSTDPDSLRTVTVTVTWNNKEGQKSKTLSTYRSRWG